MAMQIEGIIGLPPYDKANEAEYAKIKDSMPVAKIYPCKQHFITGSSTFRLKTAERYFSLLESHGYSLDTPYVPLAFLADSFPTDNFQNNYSESFLQNITSGVSQGMSSLMQTLGARTGTEAAQKALAAGGAMAKTLGWKGVGSLLDKSAGWAGETGKKIHAVAKEYGGTSIGMVAKAVDSIAAGARFDFPMIWTDSSYQPSYTMTVRLYNPNPGDAKATEKYIVAPLAAILLLGVPLSDDDSGSTYNYPFLHKIKCDGIYFLNPCFISNISVIKGGDQQQIAYNQRLGIVDVRIDFGSLYSSLLATEKPNNDRPTLKKYLEVMKYDKLLDEELSDKHFIQETDANIWSDPFNPITTKTIADLPKRISENINKTEYNILDSMIGDLGSLKRVADTGYQIPDKFITELYKNGVISADDIFSVKPDFKLPDLKMPVPKYIQNISKSSMSLLSGVGTSASALAGNLSDLNSFENQLQEMITTTVGDILPPIYFNGEKITDALTKSQAMQLIKSVQNKKNSIIDTIGSALNRMDSEVSYLNDLSSNFNNISGLTNYLSTVVDFDSYDDLMDKLKPGNILNGAENIIKDMVSSGLKFNDSNMFKGIVSTLTDPGEQMDLLKSIIAKGVDFVGKIDIIDMIKNGVHFDVKNVLLDMAAQEINFQATGVLNMILGKNYKFDATNVIRAVMEPGKSFKDTLNLSGNLKNLLDDLKDSAADTGVGIAKDLSKDLMRYVKSALSKSQNTMKINPQKYIDNSTKAATNELNKGQIMIRDYLKRQVHIIEV